MTREPDSFLKLQIRRLATGFCWAVFGIGGLTLSLTAFPVIRAATDSKETSVLRTRRLISASFRLFFRLTHLLGVMEADTAGIQCLKDKKGVILVANHPTLIDYVLIASVIPETDCIVKSALTGNFFLKRVVRAADYIVNSEDPSDLVRDAEARLAKGGVLLIFPEGTRTKPGITPTLHRGAAQIAVRTDTPIEVIQIESSDHKGSALVRCSAAETDYPAFLRWTADPSAARGSGSGARRRPITHSENLRLPPLQL